MLRHHKGQNRRKTSSSATSMAINQILVKSLDGTTICLQLPSQSISGEALKLSLQSRTGIPIHWQRLVSGTREIRDETLVSALSDGLFHSCSLLLRLRGGKGGFGSLLRGAATKAGQKKTNNFDACRDMSGRRLRHVNAEKRLEEWKAGEEERNLQKIAEQFLKKKAKEVKKSSSGAVEKYVQKYKEVSEKCMEDMEESVRQSFELYENSKRKALPTSGPASKRLKIWMGKQKMDNSDSDSDSDKSDEEVIKGNGADEKSIVLDEGNHKDSEESFGTLPDSQSDGESSGGVSGQSNLEEENAVSDQYIGADVGEGLTFRDSNANLDDSAGSDLDINECQATASQKMGCEGVPETKVVLQENVISDDIIASSPDNGLVNQDAELNGDSSKASLDVLEHPESQHTVASSPKKSSSSDETDLLTSKSRSPETVNHVDSSASENLLATLDEPLNLDNFNSVVELEEFGMEKLKRELQTHGLKCGGTLQERAARLFLLKTTSIDKLPKKLLAKPSAGGK